jgi:protein-L-isoaspartate(D-aspartate) O-methyltransferase
MSTAESRRAKMVADHLRRRDIHDPRVLAAFATVPRERFVPDALSERAYDDAPLPIGEGQTISQPYVVAITAQALSLNGHERVLEIGAGSGYAAAVLAHLASEVYTVERHAELAEIARERLERLGYRNVHVKHGDGTLGWAEHAPFDGIVVAAGGPRVPKSLLDQLAIGGRLVMPVGRGYGQQLVRITRNAETEFVGEDLGAVQFVPLIGQEGWDSPHAS